MNETAVTILVAVLSSSGLIGGIFSVINTVLSRRAARSDKQKEIEAKLAELEAKLAELEKTTQENKMDATRVQMLLLMSDYPDDTQEILKIAELYFKDMGGNFYMDSLFNKWLKKSDVTKPSWFKNND